MFSFSRISTRIKKNEGFRSSIYKDQLGNLTIGYGHLINPKDVFSAKKRYSKKILLSVFYNDLNKAILDFKKNFYYKDLSNNIQEVIIEMIFQLGEKKFLKFKKTIAALKEKKLLIAAEEILDSKMYKQVPIRARSYAEILKKQA